MQRKSWLIVALFGFMCTSSLYSASAADEATLGAKFFATTGVVEGRNGDMALDKPIKRAEMMKVLMKIATEGQEAGVSYPCFEDTDEQHWFTAYACWGERQGIVHGINKSKNDSQLVFAPGKDVTYAEAMKMVVETFHIEKTTDEAALKGRWYEVYAKTLIDAGILEADVYGKLARPMPRGEVFEMLYKAMVLKETGKSTYVEDDGKRFPPHFGQKKNEEQAVVLTEGQKKIQEMILAQLSYGMRPTTEKSNLQFSIDARDREGFGTDALSAVVTVIAQEKTQGTASTLEGYENDMTIQAKIAGNMNEQKTSATVHLKTKFMLSGTGMLFVRLDDFSIEDLEASEEMKSQILMIRSVATTYTGKWYGLNAGTFFQDDVLKAIAEEEQDSSVQMWIEQKLPRYLSKLQVQLSQEGSLDVLSIRPTAASLKTIMHDVVKMDVLNYNKYAYMSELHKADEAIDTLVEHLSFTMKMSSQTRLLTFMNILFTEWTYMPAQDNTNDPVVTVSLRSTTDVSYPEKHQITFPQSYEDATNILGGFLPFPSL